MFALTKSSGIYGEKVRESYSEVIGVVQLLRHQIRKNAMVNFSCERNAACNVQRTDVSSTLNPSTW